jgi:hypothetical protein
VIKIAVDFQEVIGFLWVLRFSFTIDTDHHNITVSRGLTRVVVSRGLIRGVVSHEWYNLVVNYYFAASTILSSGPYKRGPLYIN